MNISRQGGRLSSKTAIVRSVRRLHAAKEPLNLHAVRRHHPDLLKAVYAVRPFWGWRRCLEDAGINYADIRIELLPEVKCHLCGRTGIQLVSHVRQWHDTEIEEYRLDYPGAELKSEQMRAQEFRRNHGNRKNEMPHWEPLWSDEYILDRAWFLHVRHGMLLNSISVHRFEPSLWQTAMRRFGSWDKVIRGLGMEPRKVRKMLSPAYRTKEEVIEGIAARLREGKPLDVTAVTLDAKTKDSVLSSAANQLFGSWREALKAAGVDGNSVMRRATYPDEEAVIAGIRTRKNAGLPMGAHTLSHGAYNQRNTSLHSSALKFFGGWTEAMTAAGFDYVPQMPVSRYPDPAAVLKEIRRRRRAGLRVNSTAVACTDRALVVQARKLFGTWAKAMKAAR